MLKLPVAKYSSINCTKLKIIHIFYKLTLKFKDLLIGSFLLLHE